MHIYFGSILVPKLSPYAFSSFFLQIIVDVFDEICLQTVPNYNIVYYWYFLSKKSKKSVKGSGKMCLKIILKLTKEQDFTPRSSGNGRLVNWVKADTEKTPFYLKINYLIILPS